MARKKILCISLQNKAQGLDKLSLQSKDSHSCAGGQGGSALPCSPGTTWITAIPATTELSVFGDAAGMCQLEFPTMSQGNDFLTQMKALSDSPGAQGHIQSKTHSQAPEMNLSSLPLMATRL